MGFNTARMLKVSVIMPTYNRAHMVSRAIESFLKQNYQNAELVIMNNGSTDNTKEVLSKYANVKNIAVFHSEVNDKNVLNALWKRTTGNLICQLHDDDQLTMTSIRDRVAIFNSVPADVVYGGVVEQDLAGYPLRTIPGQPVDPDRIQISEYINFTTMMWRTDLPFRFDNDLYYYKDWFFKIRCLNECRVSHTSNAVMRYTIHPGQESVSLRGTGSEEEKIMRNKIKMLGYGR